MGKDKLRRFADNDVFQHVLQPPYEQVRLGHFPHKGRWNADLFRREAPLVLELGCGKGEYTTGLAALLPERNYVGVDIKGARIWRGACTALEQQLNNVFFLRTHVDHLADCFGPSEVSEIWLTFSDPHPKKSKARKRLTSPLFMQRYRQVLRPGGLVHLKTDSSLLYEYTLEELTLAGIHAQEQSADVYGDLVMRTDEPWRTALQIRTTYERMWLAEGRRIHYVRFTPKP
jgi:tRNA (guanine-N7-)-methyltransferase